MRLADILNLIETNHDKIVEALREADRAAYRHTSCEYSVALFPDGTVEQRERLAGDNWWYENDPAVAEFGRKCYQYFDVMGDGYNGYGPLSEALIAECNETELEAYNAYLAEYQRKKREYYEDEDEYVPESDEICEWFRENSPVWERLEEMAIEEFTTGCDADDSYEADIDSEIESLKMQYEED